MSLTIQPFEQVVAETLTTWAIVGGQKGNAAAITARANAALAVASTIGSLASGNVTAAATALQAAVTTAGLEPGFALALQSLLGIVSAQAQAIQTAASAIPLAGEVLSAIDNNIVAGMTAAANAELAKYAQKTAT